MNQWSWFEGDLREVGRALSDVMGYDPWYKVGYAFAEVVAFGFKVLLFAVVTQSVSSGAPSRRVRIIPL